MGKTIGVTLRPTRNGGPKKAPKVLRRIHSLQTNHAFSKWYQHRHLTKQWGRKINLFWSVWDIIFFLPSLFSFVFFSSLFFPSLSLFHNLSIKLKSLYPREQVGEVGVPFPSIHPFLPYMPHVPCIFLAPPSSRLEARTGKGLEGLSYPSRLACLLLHIHAYIAWMYSYLGYVLLLCNVGEEPRPTHTHTYHSKILSSRTPPRS